MAKIGIIITLFERNKLLFKSVQSLLDNWQNNFELIIVDQGHYSGEKSKWVFENNLINNYYYIPFDSGLSASRNYGVKKAKELGCDYVIIGSDSFLFNKSIQKINEIVDLLNSSDYSFCGFDLTNTICGWEAKLNLIEGQAFELDFVDKKQKDFDILTTAKPSKEYINEDGSPALVGDVIPFWKVDICRNFFIAKIDMLLNIQWDENFRLLEHEDFFYRVKQAGYSGLWTNYI